MESDSTTLNDDSSLATDINQMKTDFSTEQTDYRTEQSDSCDSMGVDADGVGTLQGLGASPDTNSAGAVAAGKKASLSAASAITWADGQGNTINNEAQQLATTAQNYAESRCG